MATVTNRRSLMTLYADPKDLQGHSVRLVLMEKDISVEINYVDDVETTAITTKAKGSKCSICWKIKETACDRANCAVN